MAKKVTDTKVLGAVAKHFDKFHESENFSEILNNFTSLCELLEIQPTHFVNFYPDLKVRNIFKRSFVFIVHCKLLRFLSSSGDLTSITAMIADSEERVHWVSEGQMQGREYLQY